MMAGWLAIAYLKKVLINCQSGKVFKKDGWVPFHGVPSKRRMHCQVCFFAWEAAAM